MIIYPCFFFFFFFNDTATTEIYTLSLHDALHIWTWSSRQLRLPDSDSTSMPSSALTTAAFSGHGRPPRAAFSTAALYDSALKKAWSHSYGGYSLYLALYSRTNCLRSGLPLGSSKYIVL